VGARFTLVEAEVIAQYVEKLFLHQIHLWEVELFGICCPVLVLGG